MQRIHIILAVLLLTASCRVIQPNKMFTLPDGFEYSQFKPSDKEYIIKPFDKISLRIYTNEGINLIGGGTTERYNQQNLNIYLVEYDGLVKVPVLDRVKISGLTIKEAEKMLENEYAKYYQKPFVIVEVTNRRVIMFSAGSQAGTVIYLDEENFTLIEAIARAGGISDFSKSYKIKLIRGDLSNPEVYMVNLSNLDDLKKANLLLQANDIIYVDTRPKYASRLLSEITPYISILTTILVLIQIVK